jgi:hypothetical protein
LIDTQDEQAIFWLSGLAGTGKLTIAYTIMRKYFDMQRLVVSFFFSRGGGEVSQVEKFVTSITPQMASNIPSLDQRIYENLVRGRNIIHYQLLDQ